MTTSSKEEALFQAAAPLSSGERDSFLDRECAGDPVLRARLHALLAAHDEPDTLVVADALALPADLALPQDQQDSGEIVGQVIGRYKLLERLGEGGCGIVYVAEQTEPVRRRIALKLIKPGMDSRSVIARFEGERQALAMMDHPNIARVLDAGTTDSGRPYFVMELVRGIPITGYCDRERLAIPDRLDLFIKVCQAIQHAHQKGIIHRDIKPSNVLVTLHDGRPVPKVIDFGIAKATEGRLTDATVYTQLHQFLGTPAYMSPEQAEMSGLDIDTRSDIYSLGVLLYELLAGVTPFDAKELMSQGLDVMRHTIREREPVRPSARITQLQGTHQRTRSFAPPSPLASDLDWIVMKCLEKDRARRYETANGLAADLRRHLGNEPIVARPPSLGYRFAKAVRRHWVASAATASILVALIAGAAVAAVGLRQAIHQRNLALAARADEARQRAEAQQHRAAAELEGERARRNEAAVRRLAYTSDMNLAQRALAENNLGRTRAILDRHRPKPGETDLRGWEWRYLWQQCRSDARGVLPSSSNLIGSLAASADGRLLAVGDHHGGGLSLRDARSGLELGRQPAGEDGVLVAFSPREPLLAYSIVSGHASARPLGRVRLWNVAVGEPTAELELDGVCRFLAFTEDGSTLAAATFGESGTLSLWRPPEIEPFARIPIQAEGHDAGTAFALSADGRMAAHLTRDGQITVIDLPHGVRRWTRRSDAETVLSLAFSRNGNLLASGAGILDGQIQLWDTGTGEEIVRLPGHRLWVSALLFLPDGRTLASAGADQRICLWDLTRLDHIPPPRVLRGHLHEIWRFTLLSDQRTLVSGAKDGSLMVWDTHATGDPSGHFTLPGSYRAWHFSSSSGILVCDTHGNLSERTGARFGQSRPLGRVPSDSKTDCFSEDGHWLATVSPAGRLQVWDLLRPFSPAVREFEVPSTAIPLFFTREARSLVVSLPSQGECRAYDLETGRMESEWRGIVGRSTAAQLTRPPRCLQLGYDGAAIATELATHHQIRLPLALPYAQDIATSPDGRYCAAVSDFGLGRVWKTDSFAEVATIRSVILGMHSVGFSPVESRLAIGGNGAEALQLFEPESDQPLLSLPGQGTMFRRTAFSPDGQLIGSLNQQGTLHLWHAASWQDIAAAEQNGSSAGSRQ